MEEIPQESNILFHISNDQVDLLAKHFGYDTDHILVSWDIIFQFLLVRIVGMILY